MEKPSIAYIQDCITQGDWATLTALFAAGYPAKKHKHIGAWMLLAANHRKRDVFEVLLDAYMGIPPEAPCTVLPLECAVVAAGWLDLLPFVPTPPPSPPPYVPPAQEELLCAALDAHEYIVARRLFIQGANPATTSKGCNILHVAAELGWNEGLRLGLAHGVNPWQINHQGEVPWRLAEKHHFGEMAHVLKSQPGRPTDNVEWGPILDKVSGTELADPAFTPAGWRLPTGVEWRNAFLAYDDPVQALGLRDVPGTVHMLNGHDLSPGFLRCWTADGSYVAIGLRQGGIMEHFAGAGYSRTRKCYTGRCWGYVRIQVRFVRDWDCSKLCGAGI